MHGDRVSRDKADYVLQTQRTTRCFGVGPAGKWVTILDSLSSVYGEPHFCHERGDYYDGDPLVILEPDLGAELLRQQSCKSFLSSLSKIFPSVWLQVLDGMGVGAQLYLSGREVGILSYPTKINGFNTVEVRFENGTIWPNSARFPSSGDTFGQRDPSRYELQDHLALARYIGWEQDSVTLGFTIDHEGTNWEFSVPENYDLFLFDVSP